MEKAKLSTEKRRNAKLRTTDLGQRP